MHRRLTARAVHDRFWPRFAGFDDDVQDELHQRQQAFCVAVQEAVVPGPAKALWQDVLEHQPQEVLGWQGTEFRFTGSAFGVAECHHCIVLGDDVVFADNAAVEVTRQVFQGRLAFSEVFAVHDPFTRQLIG